MLPNLPKLRLRGTILTLGGYLIWIGALLLIQGVKGTISFFFPFLDVAMLYLHNQKTFLAKLIVPLPIIFLCIFTGIFLCALTIITTLLNSFIPSLIPNETWIWLIGAIAVICLIICATAAMLTSSKAGFEAIEEATTAEEREESLL